MKVCIVGSSGVPIPSEYGGAVERHIYDLARFLARSSCEVHILTMRTQGQIKHEVMENVHIHRGAHFAYATSGATAKTVWKHLAFFGYVFANLLRLDTDLIHAHNGMPGLAALLASRVKGVPFIFTNHTPYTSVHHKIAGESMGLKGRFEDFQVTLEKICARNASAVIATSRKVRDGLLSLSVSGSVIFLVPNGVDLQKFREDSTRAIRAREKFGLDGKAIVLYVGRIVRSKGLDYLVEAARQIVNKHPHVKFIIAGPVSYYSSNVSTPYYQELRKKIESRQLSEYFHFTGAVNEEDLMDLYSVCEMLILPSLSEGFGMVLTEAMSFGKPVIGSRIDGILDIIYDGTNGYLISPAQPLELASTVNHLLDHPEEGEKMGRCGLIRAKKDFDWNKIAQRIMEIYDKAIREY